METVQKWEYSVLLYKVYNISEEDQHPVDKSRASLQEYGNANIINNGEVNHQDLPSDQAHNFYRYYFEAFGNQGWELVNATDTKYINADGIFATKRLYFKRPCAH